MGGLGQRESVNGNSTRSLTRASCRAAGLKRIDDTASVTV